ncbi:MAG TPA: S1 RNA-binding domain-containing protein [Dissulfurispiraceae bacterium]|nr:S1 RNA-binding domain-containing protein [Dissulfurispiraceae bacterium]
MVDENKSAEQDNVQEESFADLLEKSMTATERLEPGKKITVTVISVSGEYVFVEVGGKSEGAIAIDEFRDETGAVTVKPGDKVTAVFLSVRNGLKELTTKLGGVPAAKLNVVRAAFDAKLPIVGDVKREVKGGFEVSVGGLRCFCPLSQIDLKAGREGGLFVGQAFSFKILELSEDGRNIVLSRRALLEEERQAKIEKLKETLTVGQDVIGTIRSVQNFGAFVDLGGVDGMIPVSEMGWGRVEKAQDVFAIGQEVTARIIAIDWDKKRLTLSIKAMQPDPWADAASRYQAGGKTKGIVVRLAQFGAFVSLEPGLDGLIHISNFGTGRRINHPREVVEVGQAVEVYITAVDPAERRISLSLQPQVVKEAVVLPKVGDVVGGTVAKIMPYGVFVKMESGLTGLIPNEEMGTQYGADHTALFPQGTAIQTLVIDVDAKQAKIRLSRKGLLEKSERDEVKQYLASQRKLEDTGEGTLGALLKAKMAEKGLKI